MERPVLVFVRQPEQLVEGSSDGGSTRHTVEGLEVVYECQGIIGQAMSGRQSSLRDVAIRNIIPPLRLRFRSRELCMRSRLAAISEHERPYELIQCRTDIM